MPNYDADENYDAFAEARWCDTLKVLNERTTLFQMAGLKHTAHQDITDGGWIEDTIVVRWRPKPGPNGYNHDISPGDQGS